MGDTIETNETEVTAKNGLTSVFFRVLKGFWRFIRFVFRLVFGPVGLAVLVVLLLGDFWLESHGLSGATCDKWFGIGDGPLLKCKRVKAGIFNGVVLQGVSFDMNTKAGPLVVNARRIAGKLNWFGLTEEYGWIPNKVEAHGVKLDLLGTNLNSIMKGDIYSCTLDFEEDEQLALSLKGKSLGILLEVNGHFANARKFIKRLPKESNPVIPDPKLSAKLEKLSKHLNRIDKLSDDSNISLNVEADCLDWEKGSLDCDFAMPDLLVNGVVVSKFRGHLNGGMDKLEFDKLNIILSRSEVFNGKGTFYPRTMEIEMKVDGEMAPSTACQLAGVETKDWLSHRIHIPVLAFDGELPRCHLNLEEIAPKLTCTLKTSFEAFGIVVEKGDFNLKYKNKTVVVDRFKLVLSKNEYINGNMSFNLNLKKEDTDKKTKEDNAKDDKEDIAKDEKENNDIVQKEQLIKGQLTGKIIWLERLKNYGVELPWKILNSDGESAEFDVEFQLHSLDLKTLDVDGHLWDRGLYFLTQPCNLMDMAFSMKEGQFSIDSLNMNLRGIDEAVSFSASCDILNGIKNDMFVMTFALDALARSDLKSKFENGLSCSGNLTYSPKANKLGFHFKPSSCHPDWVYQTYCRPLDLGASYIFALFGTKSEPVKIANLDISDWVLNDFDTWKLNVDVEGHNCHFGSFEAEDVSCRVAVTSQEVEITNIQAVTTKKDHLRLDIRVQYSPMELSIKDLELKGNPFLAEAFILNSNAQTIYKNIWSDVKWDKTNMPLLRMPTLIYKDGSPWSLTMTGHIEAENVSYHDLKTDKLDLVITLDLPSSLSVKPIALKTDDGDVYGEIALTFGGVPQCTFMVDGEEGHLDPKRLLTTINKDFAQYLKDVDFGENTRLSFEGEMFLGGDPRISVRGSLTSSEVSWKLSQEKDNENDATKLDKQNSEDDNDATKLDKQNSEDDNDATKLDKQNSEDDNDAIKLDKQNSEDDNNATKLDKLKLVDVEATWSYSSNGLAWNVMKGSFMDGSLRSRGVYEPDNSRGEFLVFINRLPYKNIEALTKKKDDKNKKDAKKTKTNGDKAETDETLTQKEDGKTEKDDTKSEENDVPGVVNGEFHGRFLAGWAGRPLHMEGGGHVAIREGDLCKLPLLKQLNEVLPGGNASRSTLGRISQLDADVEFLGNRLAINDVYTDGTIMSLRAKADYSFEDQRVKILVNGVPLQEVGILSLALRPLTWAFQAERDGTLDNWDDSKWRLKSGLLQLLNLN